MLRILSEQGKTAPGIYELMVDEASEMQSLAVDGHIKSGSTIFCIEDSKTYMLDSSGNWVEIKNNSGSGGEGGDSSGGSMVINASVGEGIAAYHLVLDKTYDEIYDAMSNGIYCVIKIDIDSIENYWDNGLHDILSVFSITTDNDYEQVDTNYFTFAHTGEDDPIPYPHYYYGD